jgi:restriction endonuclease Mrr
MPIPDFQTIMLPFIQVLEDGDTKYVREVTAALVSHFHAEHVCARRVAHR